MLLPKEHGAYGQLTFPLVTAYVVAGVTASNLLLGVSVVAGFLAHEPLLVLLGRRGSRARLEQSAAARRALVVLSALAAAAGVAAIWAAPAGARWAFVCPAIPGAFLVIAIAQGREKSWQGELAVAYTFALVAVPACLAAGASLAAAAGTAAALSAVFVAGTLAVRVVILRVRGGGQPRAMRATRWGLLTFSVSMTAVLLAAAIFGMLPWTPLLAAAPALVAASAIAIAQPPPTKLRLIGWTLVAMTTVSAVVLMAGL